MFPVYGKSVIANSVGDHSCSLDNRELKFNLIKPKFKGMSLFQIIPFREEGYMWLKGECIGRAAGVCQGSERRLHLRYSRQDATCMLNPAMFFVLSILESFPQSSKRSSWIGLGLFLVALCDRELGIHNLEDGLHCVQP